MELETAISAARHAREHGYTSYLARAAAALEAELTRMRAHSNAAKDFALGRAVDVRPGADSSTLGGAS